MPKIEISVGELFDKCSILEIKKEKGLDVDVELDKVSPIYYKYAGIITNHLYYLLKEINLYLWDIEDKKRNFEKEKKFEKDFIEYARLVYILNDERARVKRLIDNICKSEITEKKSHDGINE